MAIKISILFLTWAISRIKQFREPFNLFFFNEMFIQLFIELCGRPNLKNLCRPSLEKIQSSTITAELIYTNRWIKRNVYQQNIADIGRRVWVKTIQSEKRSKSLLS